MENTVEAVSVTVRRLRLIDHRNRERIWNMLLPVFGRNDKQTTIDLWNFVTLCVTTTAVEGIDFEIPDPDALFDVWEAAWEQFGKLDYETVQGWIKLHNHVNSSPNERKYLPPEQLSEEEKKSGQSSVVNIDQK